MSNSAINTQVAQLKIGNVQNQADNSAVYSGGVWSLKNSTALTSVTIDNSGNMGVGTTSPSSFNAAGTGIATALGTGAGASTLALYSTATTSGYLYFSRSSTGADRYRGYFEYAQSDDSLRIGTVGAERMRIDASGNLLVGRTSTVTNPGVRTPSVYVNSAMLATDGTSSSSYQYDRINFNTGQFYVLNASATGVVLTSGQTSWGAQSDIRSKKNIKPLELGLKQIKALKPTRFDYKTDESEESTRIGFIAQEVLPVLPHAVSVPEDSEQMMGVSATEMIPVLVKAIQELSAQVEELKAKLP